MYQKPKGTKDYYPEDKEVFNRISEVFRKTARSYGFSEVEAPAIESMELLTAKQGAEIKEQIFTLDKRGEEELGLRPDITVPVTRMFIQKQKELPKPVKWCYITRMWRYERPQAGRLREFYQFGTELYGSTRPEAEAEIISLIIDALTALGLKKSDIEVRLNNRQVLESLVISIGVQKTKIAEVFRTIDKKEKISDTEFSAELKKSGLDDAQIKKLENILNIKDITKIADTISGKENLAKLLDLLKTKKDFIRLDLSTARGLSYYTGTVFEVFDKKGEFRSIAGGGRYDKLVSLLGGEDCPACGFGLGFATLGLLLEDRKLLPSAELGPDYYIAPLTKKELPAAMRLADKLRAEGNNVEIDLMARNIGKQMQYADKISARQVIVLGPDELKTKTAKVKDMKSGKEKKIII